MAKITASQYRPPGETAFGTGTPDVTENVSPIFTMIGSQTMDDILKALKAGSDVTSMILFDLLEEYQARRDTMEALYQRYVGDSRGVPIKTRKLANPNKVNNKLASDFFGDVVDTKVGYFGTGIGVELSKTEYTEGETFREEAYSADADVISDYRDFNNADDVDTDLCRMAATCGYGVKLLFKKLDDDTLRQKSIFPWECIFIHDGSINEPQYAMRAYKVKVIIGNEKVERWRVEWYDKTSITFWLQVGDKSFALDPNEPANPAPHWFKDVPLIAFPNNGQMQGDCEKVLELIDAYDRTMSDVNSEVEQLRLAYMYIKGAGLNLDTKLVEEMKQTGVFPLGENGDVGFITKTLDDSVIEHHLDRIAKNVMRFAKSVDFGDASFSGQLPVIAYQIKVAGLEQKSKIAEMKFRAALRYEYALVCDYWQRRRIAEIDPASVTYTFTRQLPPNLEGEINMLRAGEGLVSQKTLFGLMSFIDDPEEEIKRLEKEKGDSIDLDEVDMPDEEMMDGEGIERPGEAGTGGNSQGNGSGGAGGTDELPRGARAGT